MSCYLFHRVSATPSVFKNAGGHLTSLQYQPIKLLSVINIIFETMIKKVFDYNRKITLQWQTVWISKPLLYCWCYVIACLFSEIVQHNFITRSITLDISQAFDNPCDMGCYTISRAIENLKVSSQSSSLSEQVGPWRSLLLANFLVPMRLMEPF